MTDHGTWRGIEPPANDDEAREIAAKLAAKGYRRASRSHGGVVRVDRPDWRDVMQEKNMQPDADQYRRVLSKDCLTVHYLVVRFVPSSCGDPTGYVEEG